MLLGGTVSTLTFPFWGISAHIQVDALSAAFLLPLHLVAGLGVIYGKAYWPLSTPKGSGRHVRFFFGLLAAALTLVFTARQGILFLVGWEIMAMAAMFLVGGSILVHGVPAVQGWMDSAIQAAWPSLHTLLSFLAHGLAGVVAGAVVLAAVRILARFKPAL